jgi:threonine 3-dehydrogenase
MGTLITGGTGFIGAEVARTLVRRGSSDLTVFDINDSPQRLDEIAAHVTIRKGDLGNFAQVLDAVRTSGPDVIYHLGGMLSLPSERNPQAAFQANAMGTYHVLEAARIVGVAKVVFSSTIGTYCHGLQQQPIDDLTLQRPQLFYGACKVFGEHMGTFYRRKYDIDFRCVRFPSIVGPGVRTLGSVQYTSRMIEESANGNPFTIWVRPDTRVTLLYVKDAALAMVALAEAPADRIQMVNYLLGGPSPSARELADLVTARLPGADIGFDVDEDMQARLDKSIHPIDDRFARDEWGWRPTYDLEAIVDDFLTELSRHPQRYN